MLQNCDDESEAIDLYSRTKPFSARETSNCLHFPAGQSNDQIHVQKFLAQTKSTTFLTSLKTGISIVSFCLLLSFIK